jgi:uncharacterized protein (DUF1697 family)
MIARWSFVAFLRAINLGRVNRVPMAGLRVALSEAGFADVTTHLQSGNVVLVTPKRSPTAVAAAVEQVVRAEFGVDIGAALAFWATLKRELGWIHNGSPWCRSAVMGLFGSERGVRVRDA